MRFNFFLIRSQTAFQRICQYYKYATKFICHYWVSMAPLSGKHFSLSFICLFFPHFCCLMFDRLRSKWKVGPVQLILILLTFAIGGSVTGFVAKKIINLFAIGQDWLWAIVYILLLTFLWPLAVILISVPFGQFRFFSKYLRKMAVKLGIIKSEPL